MVFISRVDCSLCIIALLLAINDTFCSTFGFLGKNVDITRKSGRARPVDMPAQFTSEAIARNLYN